MHMALGPVFQLVVVDMEVSEAVVQQSEEVEVVPGFQDLRVWPKCNNLRNYIDCSILGPPGKIFYWITFC